MRKPYHWLALATLALSTGVLSGCGSREAADSSSAAQIQRLADIEAIRALLIDYGRTFDARDYAAYGALFAADGEWIGGSGSYQGPEAIQGMAANGFPPEVFPNSFHIMTSISVELTGADSATAWSRWTFVIEGPDGMPVPMRAGHYDDVLVREGGEWKFERRQVVAESDD